MDKLKLVDALDRSQQLNSLLENMFIKGTCSGLDSNDPLLGLALDLCGKVTNFLTRTEAEENK